MELTLMLKNLAKSFGKVHAVNDISVQVEEGEVVGLLGTNGAGKTTTIKMILGLLEPDAGSITWKGKVLDRNALSIGYLPEERGLYAKRRIVDQLGYFLALEGVSRQETETRIDYWLDKLEIKEHKFKKAQELSKGNQQKVQIISALIHNPDLLILDEPFSGLDPVNANHFSEIISEQVDLGKTIIISSHRMDKIESICRKINIMKKGNIVLQGDLDDIKQNYPYRNLFVTADERLITYLEQTGIPFETKEKELVIKVKDAPEGLALLNNMHNGGDSLRNFKLLEPTLNDIFLEKVASK